MRSYGLTSPKKHHEIDLLFFFRRLPSNQMDQYITFHQIEIKIQNVFCN